MQGYVLTLWDCQISLLGLGYLAILALILIWPPQRGRYEELDHHSRPVALGDSCLPLLLRNQAMKECAFLPCTLSLRKRRWWSSAPQTTVVVQQNRQPCSGDITAVEPVWGHRCRQSAPLVNHAQSTLHAKECIFSMWPLDLMARSMLVDGAAGHRNLMSVGTAEARWGPLAILAAYAALDFVLQYGAPAVAAQEVLHVPQSLLDFLQVGIGARVGVFRSLGQPVLSPDDPCTTHMRLNSVSTNRKLAQPSSGGWVSWLSLPRRT